MITIEVKGKNDWYNNLIQFEHSVYILPQWIDSITNEENEALYINFLKNNEIVGKISGISNNGAVKNKKNLLFYAGPAVKENSPDLVYECTSSLVKYAIKNKYNRLIILSNDYNDLHKKKIPKITLVKRYEYKIDLSVDKDTLFKNMNSNARRSYNKAIKQYDAQLHETNSPEYLNKLIELLDETKRIRLSKGYKDYSIYCLPHFGEKNLVRLIKNNIGKLYYATNDSGKSQCVVYCIENNITCYVLLMGACSEAYTQALPTFLYISLILYQKEKGLKYINFGGLPPDSSRANLKRYKLSLGNKEFVMIGGTTRYLTYPKKLLNPFFWLGQQLPENNIKDRIKQILGRK